MAGRTWFPRDCNLTADPKVGLIGAEFGAEGVLAFEDLLAVAKLEQNGGHGQMAYSQLASRALIRSPKKASAIVARLDSLGLIELEDANGASFAYRVPKWTRWNDPTAAERKAAERAKRDGVVT